MKSIAVTKPDMGVLSRDRLMLSPFGALAQAFGEELLARAEQSEGPWPYLPLELLEEGEEPPAPVPGKAPVLEINLQLVLEALRREGKPSQQQRATERIVERVLQMQRRPARPSRSEGSGLRPMTVLGTVHQEIHQHIAQTIRLSAPSSQPGTAGELARKAKRFSRQLQTLREEGATPVPPSGLTQGTGVPVRAAGAAGGTAGASAPHPLPPQALTLLEEQGEQAAREAQQAAQVRSARLLQRARQLQSAVETLLEEGGKGAPSRRVERGTESHAARPGRSGQTESQTQSTARSGRTESQTRSAARSGRTESQTRSAARSSGTESQTQSVARSGQTESQTRNASRSGRTESQKQNTAPTQARPEETMSHREDRPASPTEHRDTASPPERRPTSARDIRVTPDRPLGSAAPRQGMVPGGPVAGNAGTAGPDGTEMAQVYPVPGGGFLTPLELSLLNRETQPEGEEPFHKQTPAVENTLPSPLAQAGTPAKGESPRPAPWSSPTAAKDIRVAGAPSLGAAEEPLVTPGRTAQSPSGRAGTAGPGGDSRLKGIPGDTALRPAPLELALPSQEEAQDRGTRRVPEREPARETAESTNRAAPVEKTPRQQAAPPRSAQGETRRTPEGETAGTRTGSRDKEPAEMRARGGEPPGEGERTLSRRRLSSAARDIRMGGAHAPGRSAAPEALPDAGQTLGPAHRPLQSAGQAGPPWGGPSLSPLELSLLSQGEAQEEAWGQQAPPPRKPFGGMDGKEPAHSPVPRVPGEAWEERGRDTVPVRDIRVGKGALPVPGQPSQTARTMAEAGGPTPVELTLPAPEGAQEWGQSAGRQTAREGGAVPQPAARSSPGPWTVPTSARDIRIRRTAGHTAPTAPLGAQRGAGAPPSSGIPGGAEMTLPLGAQRGAGTPPPLGIPGGAEMTLLLGTQRGGEMTPSLGMQAGTRQSAPGAAQGETGAHRTGGTRGRAASMAQPLSLTYGPAPGSAAPPPPERQESAQEESEFVRSLPDWARRFLKQSRSPAAAQTMGVAREIASLPSAQEADQVQWTAPNYHPPRADLTHREKQQPERPQAAREAEISEAELQRTADRVYRIIEDRLRWERRRLGF